MDISAIPWIAIVLVAAVLGTLSAFLDNYTTDVIFAGKHSQAEKLFFGPAYLILGIVLLVIFQPNFESVIPLLLLFGAGAVTSFGSIPYFAGLQREETTTAKIFAQLVPIFSLVLGWVCLGQEISGRQLIAFAVILAAPAVIIAFKRKRSKRMEFLAAGMFILYGIFSAVSALLFVLGSNMLEGQNFLVSVAVFVCGKGTFNVLVMACKKKWRRHFYRRWKVAKWQMLGVMGLNFVVWQATDLLYRFALVEAESVALVSATYEAVELIATFFLGVVFSLLWPSFGREKLDKRTVMAHLIATGVAVVGILLIK